MIRSLSRIVLAVASLSVLAVPAFAQDDHAHPANGVSVGDLEISGAFTRATLPSQPVGGGYLVITNTGSDDDRLIGGTASFAGDVQVHEMAMANDVMTMRELSDGLVIPAGETVTLQPGGYHIMFMALNAALVEGEHVDVTLEFERAGTIDIEFAVTAAGARSAPGHDGHGCEGDEQSADCAHNDSHSGH